MALLGWLFLGMGLLAPVAALHYLNQLPYAPACPHCRAVTAQRAHGSAWDRLCASIATTPVRSCNRCGWKGRMRWRWALQGAHRGRMHR